MPTRIQPTPREVEEIRHRAARVLKGLRHHESYVGGRSFEKGKGKAPKYAESRFPTGFNVDVLNEGPPSKRRSLHGHYAYRIRETLLARDHWGLVRVVCDAEVDLAILNGTYVPIGQATDAEHVARVLRDYKGTHSAEVAVRERCAERWVRLSRVNNGLDPNYGDEPDSDERRARIVRMVAGGMSQRQVARELGVNAMTVTRALVAA